MTPFHQPLRMAFQKLTGRLDTKPRYTLENLHEALSFRPFAPEDADLETFQIVTRGLQERRALTFRNITATRCSSSSIVDWCGIRSFIMPSAKHTEVSCRPGRSLS